VNEINLWGHIRGNIREQQKFLERYVERRGPRCKGPYVGPHNGCRHPTAPPRGLSRCKGDLACEVFLAPHEGGLCPAHRDQAVLRMETPIHRFEELMRS